jgi:TetR/AcrR family fatty acid metabolism transcriptional regulator
MAGVRPRRRTRLPATDRRKQILDHAVLTFARHGYERASIAHVCAEAGIARGTLYQYFDDKQALFRAVLREYAAKISEYMQPVSLADVGGPIDGTTVARFLSARFERIYTLVHEERAVYTILLKEALAKNAETEDVVDDLRRAFVKLMSTEMRLAASLGLITVDDPEFTAGFVLGGMFQTALVGILGTDQPTSPQTLAAKTTKLVLGALGVPRESPPRATTETETTP